MEAESDLLDRYRRALGDYLAHGGEEPLTEAYELGRAALSSGKGLLEVVNMHQLATAANLNGHGDGVREIVGGSGRFLIECLSPFEVLQLGNKEANAALRRLNQILEEEAKRIAHVLHDEAAQMLATVYLELSDLKREAPDSVTEHVNRIKSHLDTVREQLRRLSHELRPPILDQLGLLPALQFLGDGYRKRTELEVTVSGSVSGRFHPEIETAFYRAVQESLNNVVRHAQASRVDVRLWVRKGVMHCTIKDDGVGFEPDVDDGKIHGLGLLGIRERVSALHGSLAIKSAKGKGTELHISIPLTTEL